MSNSDDKNEFPFNDLFGSVEQIFREFDRMFFSFDFPSNENEEFFSSSSSSSSSKNLRDEVLKENSSSNKIDENLDEEISQFGFDQTFAQEKSSSSSSSVKTRFERRTTPSGKCFIEKQIEEISKNNEKTLKETTTKICGENHHTTIKINGQIQREFGNSTIEELNQIDSHSDSDSTNFSDFFKKFFS